MPSQKHVRKLVPIVLKKHRQFPHRCCVNWTVNDLLQTTPISHVHHRSLHPFQVILKTFQHRVVNLLEVFIVFFTQHFRNRIRHYRCVVSLSSELLVVSTLVFNLESLTDLKRKDYFEGLALVSVFKLKRPAFSKS